MYRITLCVLVVWLASMAGCSSAPWTRAPAGALEAFRSAEARQDWSAALEIIRAEIRTPSRSDSAYLADLRTIGLGSLRRVAAESGETPELTAEARQYFDEGMTLARGDGDRQARLRQTMGLYLSKMGRNFEAESYFAETVDHWMVRGDAAMTMVALDGLAAVANDRGGLEDRDVYRKAALELASERFVLGVAPTRAQSWVAYAGLIDNRLENLATTGDLEEIRGLIELRGQITDRYLASPFIYRCRSAKVLALAGDIDGARKMLARARESTESHSPEVVELDLRSASAQVELLAGNGEIAKGHIDAWFETKKAAGGKIDGTTWRIHGEILELLGDDEAAATSYERSIEVWESLREGYALEDRAQFFRSAVRRAYWGRLRCRAAQAEASGSPADFLEALRLTESIRARQFGELMADAKPLEAAELASLRDRLGEDEAIVDYVVMDRDTLLFVITRESFAIHRLAVGNRELAPMVAAIRARVTRSPVARFAAARPDMIDDEGRLRQDARSENALLEFLDEERRGLAIDVERLGAAILEPAADLLSGPTRITILPDGSLTALPFGLLELASVGSGPLATHVVLRQSPSLAYLARGAGSSSAAPSGFFGVGDPTFRTPDGEGTPERTGPLPALDSAARASQYLEGGKRLPNTRSEVETIADILAEEPSELSFGLDASESRVKTAPLERFRFLHFATHGTLGVPAPGLNQPALLLAHESDEDGFLTLSEAQALDLGARVTVLSACDTGSGRYFVGEGVMGMGRAFLLAGSQSVVASLWPVDTFATEDLTIRFYRYLEGGDLDPAVAMSMAQRDLIDRRSDPRFEHPYYWAPFIVLGD